MSLERVVATLAQKVEHRFYGKYRGFVVDNTDPENLGRLKLRVPSLLGPEVVTGWAMPCVPYGGMANQGFLFIPEVGAGVWVEFEEGDLEFPIWVGTFWSKPGGDSELPKTHTGDGAEKQNTQSASSRKIIKTVRGHTIQLEDGDGDERILISDGEAENWLVFSESGITLENAGNKVTLRHDGIRIEDFHMNMITQDANGTTIKDTNGNKITMDASSGYPPFMHAITLNGDKRVCLEGLVDWLKRHTHIGNMGAPCPLDPKSLGELIGQNDILSQNVKMG
jgi:uncharacterized protein involved in type VI secretion and phage assembly